MKIRQVIAFLQTQDPDAEFVTHGYDHKYDRVNCLEPAIASKEGRFLFEWYDEPDESCIPVIIVE